METYLQLNNDLKILLPEENSGDLNLDFSVPDTPLFVSPNLNLVENFGAELFPTGKPNDPVVYVDNFYKTNGITANLEAKIIQDEDVVVDGFVDVSSEDNYFGYYIDGSGLQESRVDQQIRVIHVPTKEMLWYAEAVEIKRY